MRARELLRHVKKSVYDVERGAVDLPDGLLEVGGFCGLKTRQFIYWLCQTPVRSYVEVGVLHGATLCSAIAENPSLNAVGIDNFSQPDFGAYPETTLANVARFGTARLVEADAFTVDVQTLAPIDVFFYDGDHGREATARGITHFAPALAPTSVVLVDDADWPEVRRGLQQGVEDAGLSVVWERYLTTGQANDGAHWWNGLWAAVVRKG